MTSTVGQWVDLPTSGGAADRLTTDEPGGAGILQIATSNATLATRENGLRVLWEDFGSSDVHVDLFIAGQTNTFLWSTEDADGGYVRLCGCFRVRLFGETRLVPKLRLSCRALAPVTYTTGILIAVMPSVGAPDLSSGHYATNTTTSTTLTSLTATLTLTPEMLGLSNVTPRGVDGTITEVGVETELAVWIGAWCTSGSGASKGAVYGLTVLLEEPS